jgi:hypothetical protein
MKIMQRELQLVSSVFKMIFSSIKIKHHVKGEYIDLRTGHSASIHQVEVLVTNKLIKEHYRPCINKRVFLAKDDLV